MKVLIVLAHPEPHGRSFNHAMADLAAEALGAQGHEARIDDLYANGFNPVGGPWEFDSGPEPERFEYMAAQAQAERSGTKRADVAAEQEKILWCDLMILQFPLWWFGMPAMLKGWIDRVMTNSLAYDNPGAYEKGGFRGRRAALALTTGTEPEYYEVRGRGGYIRHLLWPIENGVLRYVGFDVLPAFVADEVDCVDDAQRGRILDAYRAHLLALESARPLFFHPREDYGAKMRLKPAVLARTEMQNPALLLDKE